jgi:MoaA/NifB/PqqE/SkfB family radical SAM enzyme
LNVYAPIKAAWHLDRIAELRAGRDIVPTHVHFVISDLCNQDCHFCSYRISNGFAAQNFAENGNKNPARFVPTEKAKEILDDCAALGVKAIEFTGGGEPTVHADCAEIIGHAQALGLQTGLVTNGVRLTNEPVFRNLDWLRISLDAGTPETYETIRSSKQWSRAVASIMTAATFEKPYLGIGFVVTRENWKEIAKATALARTLGADYIRLSAMFSYDHVAHYKGLLDDIAEQRAAAREYETGEFKVIDLFGERIDDLDNGKPDYQFCGEQQFVLYIGGDQKVYTCCTNAYTTHGEIGDLRQARFADWLRSHRRHDFDARGCHHCQFNDKNRIVNFLLDPAPKHVDFV